jgi:RND family efflux transporter MFP subunit
MKKYHLLLRPIIAIIFLTFLSCNGNRNKIVENKEKEVIAEDIVELRDDQVKLAKIDTGVIEFRSLSSAIKVSGTVTVAPQNYATVCIPTGGFIKSTNLMPGNAVSKGQTLAIIENQEFVDIQQNYIEAKSKLEYAEAEYQRHTELYKDDVYSQKNVQQVTSEYKSLKAQVKALEQKLTLIHINPANLNVDDISSSIALTSPISGYVKSVNINIGKYVTPSDVLFEIVNNDKLFLELTLFEKDADKVSAGQKIRFFINNETDQHEAILYQTGKSVNTDRTYNVFASVSGTCKNLLPGMYVNAIIETSINKVVALPTDAIVSFDDKTYIFVFEKTKIENGQSFNEYRMVEIKKGVAFEGYTEVIFPKTFDIISAKVVIKGAYNLLSAKKNAGEMACG